MIYKFKSQNEIQMHSGGKPLTKIIMFCALSQNYQNLFEK